MRTKVSKASLSAAYLARCWVILVLIPFHFVRLPLPPPPAQSDRLFFVCFFLFFKTGSQCMWEYSGVLREAKGQNKQVYGVEDVERSVQPMAAGLSPWTRHRGRGFYGLCLKWPMGRTLMMCGEPTGTLCACKHAGELQLGLKKPREVAGILTLAFRHVRPPP